MKTIFESAEEGMLDVDYGTEGLLISPSPMDI
jgi:hypothetical protein